MARPHFTFLWDGTELDLREFMEGKQSSYFKKQINGRNCYVRLDKKNKDHIIITEPVSDFDDLELRALKSVFAEYFDQKINSLVCSEIIETGTNKLTYDGQIAVATLCDLLNNKFKFMISAKYNAVKKMKIPKLLEILDGSPVFYPDHDEILLPTERGQLPVIRPSQKIY